MYGNSMLSHEVCLSGPYARLLFQALVALEQKLSAEAAKSQAEAVAEAEEHVQNAADEEKAVALEVS